MVTKLILLLGLIIPSLVQAKDYSLGLRNFEPLSVEHVSVDTWKTKSRRDPYQPELTGRWTNGAAFNLNLRLLRLIRWDNKLHMDGVQSQLRHVGWEFHLFMDYFRAVQPFYYHHSQHSLDERGVDSPYTSNDFPVVDTYGLRFTFLDKPNPNRSSKK